ncbi:hypothetical protein [Paramicrobacterium agarici]|uniref:hypothetical protein n=1 Tax=Paramicrobacterium agarici TaxID=630514 RepID=UPI001150CF81|nr:hypothetical protein [Microbacterium agarici]TQO21455.1 hypothetical protein FB385_0257 [Microbacterium agarici]
MPRLTSKDYLAQRRLLIEEWFERDMIAFGNVSFQAQHDLHDFYAPTEPFSDAEALKHRAVMTKGFPSLPQKAGRALQALLHGHELHEQRLVAAHEAVGRPSSRTAKSRGVRIAAAARQKTDLRLLAKAIVELSISDTDGSLLSELEERQRRKRP